MLNFLLVLILSLIALAAYFIVYFLNKVEKSRRLSFEDVFNDINLIKKYGLGNRKDPEDYGFNYSEHSYHSKDALKLSAWFINSKNIYSRKAIVFVHGRNSNRLACLQYLNLIKRKALNEEYAVFMPDMRNSGKSDGSRTFLGSRFADDIYSTLRYLKNTQNKNEFILYGFSMGAMAIEVFLHKYRDILKGDNITVGKVILDSPLTNVEKTIKYKSKNRLHPKFLQNIGLRILNMRMNYNIKNMRFSILLSENKEMPTFILQSKTDSTTPYYMLKNELSKIENTEKNMDMLIVDNASHVCLYRGKNKKNYQEQVARFISKD